ncbi:exodeoxyribonuclease V subunit beta [Desulfosediminicola ganghwensis]|uniref:exodeoxyribonuclease V subunit beta n=1 Tax=Desulfosediminicola ganghwensis TaxID=2569540 RepID=UPI00142EC4F4|nr:exodeoxyribonuclease V subunit beta [Desulfosediminicola ganghwensis]
MVDQFLDSARSKLNTGINLIEASAGTGKTYAIGMLVLRAITELEIPIDRILVVTFTKAATEELRGRIRQRLAQARDLLDGGATADATILSWLETVQDRERAKKLLQLGLYDIDRAGIFTIHSFCQRMLTEQALESGQLFDVELLADIDRIREQVVQDFWRNQVYPLSPRVCGVLTDHYQTPGQLYKSVFGVASGYDCLEPQLMPLADIITRFETSYDDLGRWWAAHADTLRPFFENALADGKFKKKLQEGFDEWWQRAELFFGGQSSVLPNSLNWLTVDGLKGELNSRKVKKNVQDAFLADWPLPVSNLPHDFDQAATELLLSFRSELIKTLESELRTRLQELGYMSFDDLIRRLDEALDQADDLLSDKLGERFKMALIDEFQDTDSAQWRIFSRLFGDDQHYLYLIGDPKQAIYRFRGADIYSYFKARNEAGDQLTLQRNYRSHPQLVEEVNRLFSARTRPFDFDETQMPFYPVEPAKTADDGTLLLAGEPLGVMHYCQLAEMESAKDGRWASGKAAQKFQQYVIYETCRLLHHEQPAKVRKVLDGKVDERKLQARDIAVLVRTNRQANEYLQAFARVGVPAIVTSKTGVFETTEARELHSLLQGLVVPGDSYRLKAAMTISWFSHTGNELQRIWESETEYDNWFNRFLEYYQLWQDKGFLSMMNRLLSAEDVYVNLAQESLAERRIANIMHLIELVQEAETEEKLGPDQTLLWLQARVAGDQRDEDRELRLESDEQAVRIVTMHSAKGLQYPVVFCPVLWYRSGMIKMQKELLSCHDEDHRLVVDIGSDNFEMHRERALAEELAEDLRLLYVALTRAELRCYTMWADVKSYGKVMQSFESALGYLLFAKRSCSSTVQQELFADLAANPGVEHSILAWDTELQAEYSPEPVAAEPLKARVAGGRLFKTDYQMSSYSAMAALSEQEDHGSETSLELIDLESQEPILHRGLPAGANFGNLIHDSLELIPFAELAIRDKFPEYKPEIERLSGKYGVDVQAERVQELLASVVKTPLRAESLAGNDDSFSLADLDESRCMKEMPFYFHMKNLDTTRLNTLLAHEPAVVPLTPRQMQGYLTGFVDLVCEYRGRFYVLDYKTNFLGELSEEYQGQQLTEAMAHHNYGLQYWIYSLVLHRFLDNMLGGYSYEQHFGGVMYLFVRGMNPSFPASGVYSDMPDYEILRQLDLAIGGRDEIC